MLTATVGVVWSSERITVRPFASLYVSNGSLMESEADDFFWPNKGADNEIASTRARADTALRLLITRTPFTLWLVFRAGRSEIIRANLWLCKPLKFHKPAGRRCSLRST